MMLEILLFICTTFCMIIFCAFFLAVVKNYAFHFEKHLQKLQKATKSNKKAQQITKSNK